MMLVRFHISHQCKPITHNAANAENPKNPKKPNEKAQQKK